MPLIDPREFERGKKHAAAQWCEQCEDDVAEAFSFMRLEACRFGTDESSRIAWTQIGGLMLGLRFDLETSEYRTSFFRRPRPKET